MDETELLKIVEKDESETAEFKKSTAQIEKALKAICGFLNHKGGTVFFGIDGKEIIGQDISDSTIKSLSQKIRQRIKPEVSPEIKVLEIGGKKVIEVNEKTARRDLKKLVELNFVEKVGATKNAYFKAK